jgi:hypothetical protein
MREGANRGKEPGGISGRSLAHRSWDSPLGKLNNRWAAVGAPALSALVILEKTGEPGGGFGTAFQSRRETTPPDGPSGSAF